MFFLADNQDANLDMFKEACEFVRHTNTMRFASLGALTVVEAGLAKLFFERGPSRPEWANWIRRCGMGLFVAMFVADSFISYRTHVAWQTAKAFAQNIKADANFAEKLIADYTLLIPNLIVLGLCVFGVTCWCYCKTSEQTAPSSQSAGSK